MEDMILAIGSVALVVTALVHQMVVEPKLEQLSIHSVGLASLGVYRDWWNYYKAKPKLGRVVLTTLVVSHAITLIVIVYFAVDFLIRTLSE
jgi:hypothetical protein